MSRISNAVGMLRVIFDQYAGKEGDAKTLTKGELIELLHNEFPVAGTNKAEADQFFSMLDGDRDGVVDFKEFVTFVTAIAVIATGE